MKKTSPEERKAIALDFIRGKHRPVLVGEVAIFLGPYCTIAQTESLLAELEASKLIRLATQAEMAKYEFRVAYVPV